MCVCVRATVRQAGWTIWAQLEHSIRMRAESPLSSWLGSLQTSHTADRGRPGWRGRGQQSANHTLSLCLHSARGGWSHSQRDTASARRSASVSLDHRTSSCPCKSCTLHTRTAHTRHSACTCSETGHQERRVNRCTLQVDGAGLKML